MQGEASKKAGRSGYEWDKKIADRGLWPEQSEAFESRQNQALEKLSCVTPTYNPVTVRE
jgi:hypothetical protein